MEGDGERERGRRREGERGEEEREKVPHFFLFFLEPTFLLPAHAPRPRRRARVLRGLRHLQLLHVPAGLLGGRVRGRRRLLCRQGRRPPPGPPQEGPPPLEDGRAVLPRVPAGGAGLRRGEAADVRGRAAGFGAGRRRRDERRGGALPRRQGLRVGRAGEQRLAGLGAVLPGAVLHGDQARAGADKASVQVPRREGGEDALSLSPFFLSFFLSFFLVESADEKNEKKLNLLLPLLLLDLKKTNIDLKKQTKTTRSSSPPTGRASPSAPSSGRRC